MARYIRLKANIKECFLVVQR